VTNRRLVVVSPGAACNRYNGGNGVRFWDPCNVDHVEAFRRAELINDIFVMAVPPNYHEDKFYIDITGTLHNDLCVGEAMHLDFCPTAHIYSGFWGFRHGRNCGIARTHFGDYRAVYNTMAFQQFQTLFNYTGNGSGDFNRVVINKGHWGEKVYPGCGKARIGRARFETPAYLGTNTFSIHA